MARREDSRKAFTLIELMVVVVILGLLAGIISIKFLKKGEQAKVIATKVQMKNIEQALKLYKLDNSVYPTTQQGIKALVEKPEDVSDWQGPYMDDVPKDAWGRDFVYTSDGETFTLISKGPDGKEGTQDDIKLKGD